MGRKRKKDRWVGGEPDWDAVAAYVWKLQNRLRLQAWRVSLMGEPCPKGFEATIEGFPGRWDAHLRLCRDWNTRPAEEQRQTLVHELLHLVFEPVEDTVRLAADQIPSDAYRLLEATLDRRVEYAIEAVCRVLAPTLPLPKGVPK